MSEMDLLSTVIWSAAVFSSGSSAAVVVWLLAGRTPLTTRRLAGAVAATAAVSAVSWFLAAAVVVGLGGRLFALIHLSYAWVALPPLAVGAAAILLGVRRARGRRRMTVVGLGLLGLVPASICAYSSFVEPYWLTVREVPVAVADWPRGAPPIRIAVLADIQTDVFGGYERTWLAEIERLAPDLILLPGDFFHVSQTLFEQRRDDYLALLRSLDAPFGVYACLGNVDPDERTRALFADAGLPLLIDSVRLIDVRGVRLAIGGTEDDGRLASNPPLLHRLRDYPADVRLLMAHRPDAVLGATADDQVDLIISGHTHGGQIVIPGFGPLITLSAAPRRVGAGGLHTVGAQRILVSRGVGFERGHAPPMRFCCRPEIVMLTLGSGE